jgi:hypothetical protein
LPRLSRERRRAVVGDVVGIGDPAVGRQIRRRGVRGDDPIDAHLSEAPGRLSNPLVVLCVRAVIEYVSSATGNADAAMLQVPLLEAVAKLVSIPSR